MRTLILACLLLSAGAVGAEEKRNNNMMATKRNNILVADAPTAVAPKKAATPTCNCSAACQCAGKSGGACNCRVIQTPPSRSRRG